VAGQVAFAGAAHTYASYLQLVNLRADPTISIVLRAGWQLAAVMRRPRVHA
jgi:hypothetical protein